MSKSHPVGTGFKAMQGSWREAEAWHCVSGRAGVPEEFPGKAIGESVAQLQEGTPADLQTPEARGDHQNSSSRGVEPARPRW